MLAVVLPIILVGAIILASSSRADGGEFLGTAGFPDSYEGNLSLIHSASITAKQRTARLVGDTGFGNEGERNYALNDGNPFRYTPSSQLSIDDYVVQTGDRYANYAQRQNGGVWHTTCQFSHFAYDDPIVFPNMPGVSHLHMFFGNTHSNAYSTPDTILNEGGSTCGRGELNRTSYWVPAVFNDQNQAIAPNMLMVYYESFQDEQAEVVGFPDGLRMVSGNARATRPQPNVGRTGKAEIRWKCGWFSQAKIGRPAPAGLVVKTPPRCDPSRYSHIEMQIRYPWCWDGVNLDSTDHKSHLAFPTGRGARLADRCPRGYPALIPRITYRLHFDIRVTGSDTSKLLLSSDVQKTSRKISINGVSVHGDWFGGWHRETLDILVKNCAAKRGESCDPEHLGDPEGRQFAKVFEGSSAFSPAEVLEYCPLRSSFGGDIYDLAYCIE